MPDNLPELRDIHLPDGVSAFPPAYGWWIILLVALSIVAAVKLIKIAKIKSKKLYALRLLKAADKSSPIKAAAYISEILRRICVYKYPEALSLNGNEWIDFIHLHSKNKMSAKTAKLLLNAPYMPCNNHTYSSNDVDELQLFCQHWIGENL